MPTLDPTLRALLATAIGKENEDGGARAVAEAGARAAIAGLAVQLAAPHPHLDTAAKDLRNQLRARARQLGDRRRSDGRHEIGRLVEQTAYEHWHRMLFARFLAENDLLIHPTMQVAVTLDECAALAPSEGAADGWELAGRFASRMLPQIFRPDDPVLAVTLAAEHQRALEALLAGLPAELFQASDSLGWCYQFWQARKKKEINASEVKIGADELPAVTQLFTEPYMVDFLLHNTLGAWWVGAGRELPAAMPYLRFLEDGAPAAGRFEGWPRLARELKVLDPCCGSGHFLVAAFEILVGFRMAEEGLAAREACDAVLRDNLFGLEIDARCVQIAAFALALTAWTYPGAGGYRPLAAMNVACSGLAVSAKKEEWERLGGDNLRLMNGMGRMWELFKDAPVLGSLIDPTRDAPSSLFAAGFQELQPLLARALLDEAKVDPDEHEVRVAASGVAQAADFLAARHHLIVTNVPYLTQGRQGLTLRRYAEGAYPTAKNDVATVFFLRAFGQLYPDGTNAMVLPHNWLFLTRYRKMRSELLRDFRWNFLAQLGEGGFESSQAAGAFVAMVAISKGPASSLGSFLAIDANEPTRPEGKAQVLWCGETKQLRQADIEQNPDSRFSFDKLQRGPYLERFAECRLGVVSGDGGRWIRKHWEVPKSNSGGWKHLQSSPDATAPYSGREHTINWQFGGAGMLRPGADNSSFGRDGVVVSQMRALPATLYTGELYDNNAAAIIPHDPTLIPALWAYCSSPLFNEAVRRIDKKIGVIHGSLLKAPFDEQRWRIAAKRLFPEGLPLPTSANPTQWVFDGRPSASDAPLQVAVARLLGYRWPDQQPDACDAHADDDGIVCIPALRGERPAAERLADLLAAAWGKDWHPQTLTDLLAAVGHTGTLDDWLRDSFFRQHCELFHHRPFVWHIWDGHRDGFSALVNYHKLDHETLKALTYSYLGDWIRTQELDAKAGKSGAVDKFAKAKVLQHHLAAILAGEAPLDVFVRWKPLEQQPIGWHPDLDDGVRLNIRPFLTVADVGGKGAGVLRYKPNVKWGKDRGKNPPGAPWGEDRHNDRHLTLAEKRAAREGSA